MAEGGHGDPLLAEFLALQAEREAREAEARKVARVRAEHRRRVLERADAEIEKAARARFEREARKAEQEARIRDLKEQVLRARLGDNEDAAVADDDPKFLGGRPYPKGFRRRRRAGWSAHNR